MRSAVARPRRANMKSLLSIVTVVVLIALYARGVESFPSGAPAAACDTLTPTQDSGRGHVEPPQNTTVPYMIDIISPFNDNGTLRYTPGQTYTLTLSNFPGPRRENFRGFFVQARMVADDTTRVGSFGVVNATNSRLSDCPTNTDGITHTNGNDKTSISFRWTAPPQGTGEVIFRFAVVRDLNTFWADQRTPRTIAEGDPEALSTTTAAARLASASFWTILTVALMGLALKAVV